jgi:hypothetical protein
MRISLLIVFLICSVSVFSQTQFDRQHSIPVTEGGNTLRLPWVGGINFPWISSIDMNNDGMLDIFLYDHHNNRLLTFLDNGDTVADEAWDFAPEYMFQFPPVNKWAFLYDFDCDGKSDFFTLSSALQCSGIAYYKNTGSGGILSWTIMDSCMQETYMALPPSNIFSNAISLPHFNDIDGDGDMDILGYNSFPDGRILYHKNYSMEDHGVCDSVDFKLETVCYGNFQLLIGGSNIVGCFHCPCRGHNPNENSDLNLPDNILQEPAYDPSDAAKRDDTVSSIFALDLDGDGNVELLVGDIAANNTLMIHNGGVDMDTQDSIYPSTNVPANFNGFHYHAFLDADNDGLKDLLVMSYDHENKNSLWLYKNSGTNTFPVFNFIEENFLQKEMIDVGEDACPVFFDYDGDNLLDLVISKSTFDPLAVSNKTGLYLYKNTGTITNPSFDLITDNFANLSGSATFVSPTYPAFGDLDGDGDQDMLIGREDGYMYYYVNSAGAGNPATFLAPQPNYFSIDIGKYATPQLFDFDRDGLLDIICGGQRGFINYFRNRGTSTTPLFGMPATNDTLGCIVLQGTGSTDGYTVPFFYDSLGSTRLLVAYENGNINQYDQIDGNLNGCFHQSGTIFNPAESSRIKFNITVSGGDINGDSLIDILIGQSTGGVELRYQHDPHIGISELIEIRPTIEVFPNPVNNEMHVRFYNTERQSSVLRLFNSLGELISEKTVKGKEAEIKTTSLANGMYFLQLISGKYSLSRKVVVRH